MIEIVIVIKRVETSGYLMATLFRQYFTKLHKRYEKFNNERIKWTLEKL